MTFNGHFSHWTSVLDTNRKQSVDNAHTTGMPRWLTPCALYIGLRCRMEIQFRKSGAQALLLVSRGTRVRLCVVIDCERWQYLKISGA